MTTSEIIAKEFSSSMSKALNNLCKGSDEKKQIVLELNGNGDNIYGLCNDFKFARILDLKEILYINPIYSVFKSKMPDVLKDFIMSLAKEHGVPNNCVSIFVARSKTGINAIRLMLYVKGEYKQELTADDLIKLNK